MYSIVEDHDIHDIYHDRELNPGLVYATVIVFVDDRTILQL